jgi:hypothetical protein
MGVRVCFHGVKPASVKLRTHHQLVASLRICGTIPPRQYVFLALLLNKDTNYIFIILGERYSYERTFRNKL